MMGVMQKSAQGWTGNKQAHTSSCLWNRAWLLLHAEHSTPHRSEPRESVTRSVPLPSSTHGMAHGTMHGRSVLACTANTRTYGFGEQVTGHMSQAKTKKRGGGGRQRRHAARTGVVFSPAPSASLSLQRMPAQNTDSSCSPSHAPSTPSAPRGRLDMLENRKREQRMAMDGRTHCQETPREGMGGWTEGWSQVRGVKLGCGDARRRWLNHLSLQWPTDLELPPRFSPKCCQHARVRTKNMGRGHRAGLWKH